MRKHIQLQFYRCLRGTVSSRRVMNFTIGFHKVSIFCLGALSGGGTPDSIPNSEVKPTSADGTWMLCPGRVGQRQD